MKRLIICTLFFICGCGNAPYRGSDVLGADDFVMDSYQIREGKFSILQLEGKSYEPLAADLLNPYQDTIHEDDVLDIALFHPTRSDICAAVEAIGTTVG